MEKKERKKGFIGWVENLWYYHKWHILVGLLVVVFLGVGVVQCMRKEEPEVTILFVGKPGEDIANRRDEILKDFGYSAKDLNGNGKIDMSFAYFSTGDKETGSKFNTEMLTGNHYIFIVNDEYYDKLLKADVLVPVSEFLGKTPEYAEEGGCGLRLKHLDISETSGFSTINRNYIICMRSNSEKGADYEAGTELYKNDYDFMDALLNYKTDDERVTVDLLYIGEQSFYTDTVYDFEYSVYKIARLFDKEHIAILNYEEQKLTKDSGGAQILDEEEIKTAEGLAKGNKIMIVNPAVFAHLKDKGLLANLKGLGIELSNETEEYGLKLSEMDRKDSTDFTNAPGFEYVDKEMYLCATADIDGYTAEVLDYLRRWAVED